ncbi:hypothetical protein [Paenibacillus marinisediminis]
MKRLTAMFCVALMVLALAACGGEKADNRTMDVFVKAFQDAGYEVDAGEKPLFDMIGATDGFMFNADNKVVKVYEFKDVKSMNDAQKKNEQLMAKWSANGKFMLETTSEKAAEVFKAIPSDK